MPLHTHTHTRLTALCPGLLGWAGTRKVKPIWILLKQETMSGSGISWAICKSAPRSRQITTPACHSVFYRPDALPAAQPTSSKHWRQVMLCLVKPLNECKLWWRIYRWRSWRWALIWRLLTAHERWTRYSRATNDRTWFGRRSSRLTWPPRCSSSPMLKVFSFTSIQISCRSGSSASRSSSITGVSRCTRSKQVNLVPWSLGPVLVSSF